MELSEAGVLAVKTEPEFVCGPEIEAEEPEVETDDDDLLGPADDDDDAVPLDCSTKSHDGDNGSSSGSGHHGNDENNNNSSVAPGDAGRCHDDETHDTAQTR